MGDRRANGNKLPVEEVRSPSLKICKEAGVLDRVQRHIPGGSGLGDLLQFLFTLESEHLGWCLVHCHLLFFSQLFTAAPSCAS